MSGVFSGTVSRVVDSDDIWGGAVGISSEGACGVGTSLPSHPASPVCNGSSSDCLDLSVLRLFRLLALRSSSGLNGTASLDIVI